MRKPDDVTVLEHERLGSIEVSTWWEPSDLPWDGDPSIDVSDCEGWDCFVKVSLTIEDEIFVGEESLGSIWVRRQTTNEDHKYMDESRNELVEQAIDNMQADILDVINGKEVLVAKKRQSVARNLITKLEHA